MTFPTLHPNRPTTHGKTVPTSSSPVVLGIDPGGHETGVVVRRGRQVLAGELVTAEKGMCAGYLREVVGAVSTLAAEHSIAFLAVEDLVHPNPHLGLANVAGLMDTAQVLGALRVYFPLLILVRPGGHGSAPLASYPLELVGVREKRGTGRMRHLRSAFDIAGAALASQGFGSLRRIV